MSSSSGNRSASTFVATRKPEVLRVRLLDALDIVPTPIAIPEAIKKVAAAKVEEVLDHDIPIVTSTTAKIKAYAYRRECRDLLRFGLALLLMTLKF